LHTIKDNITAFLILALLILSYPGCYYNAVRNISREEVININNPKIRAISLTNGKIHIFDSSKCQIYDRLINKPYHPILINDSTVRDLMKKRVVICGTDVNGDSVYIKFEDIYQIQIEDKKMNTTSTILYSLLGIPALFVLLLVVVMLGMR
jgi:hypothetical protein